ncbi:HK97 family phage prohead protease [Methylobacterium sp. Leaf100]|uniref:HK97 family phage prohead protease n=1 Tax=Methylobacterium sp. Leaf100 TaxID=1736252 RepID=UPI0006F25C70|nr:HK97 family phage prohead protease [Methylobacterium sp. Leaf100]KQP29434.1 peptidase U35 [Methylobacterium sp. Leaf100]
MDGHFTGYASLFGVPDLGRDVVAPGAFAASLRARGASGVRMLWQHDPAEPVGRWLSLTEDARGLRVAGQLNLAVQRARELDALLREGALDGLSIGFRTVRASPDRGGLRRLHSLDLWEISLVTFPLQPGARIAAKSAPSESLPSESLPLAQALHAFARRVAPPRAHPSTRPVAAPSPRAKRFA